MKANLTDKEVCHLCHGTGYQIIRRNGRNYSRPCKRKVKS